MRRSHAEHTFAQVPAATIPRAKFNRSYGRKMTFNEGYLNPVFVDEVLPGDTFNCRMQGFTRMLSPLTYPIMDNMYLDTFFFFVPNRLIWNNWEKFNGAQDNPGDSTSFVVPTATSPASGYVNGTLQDFYGLPTAGTNGVVAGGTMTHNNLPIRAYNLIYNTWFRDENLQNSVTVDKGDGPDTYSNYVLLRRGKRHDYFTSCLPWPQKGTAVTIGLSGNANVIPDTSNTNLSVGAGLRTRSDAVAMNVYTNANPPVIQTQTGTGATGNLPFPQGTGAGVRNLGEVVDGATATGSMVWAKDIVNVGGTTSRSNVGLVADLTGVSATTINALRQSFQIQKMYERDARGGTRYTEILRAHFGVVSPDARLQRPEYLGGGSTPINVHTVAQTQGTGASGTTTAQGNLAAFVTGSFQGHGFTKSFVEHGYIIGLVSVRAELTYQQGLPRMFSRSTRFDFYWPALAMIGEQAVLNQEIQCQGTGGTTWDAGVFGYQERYAEYRYKPSEICGQFRSSYATTLDAWHLSQSLVSPALNATFIVENAPMSRVKAVTTAPDFLLDAWFQLTCARPMPVFGVPGLIDHF